MDALYIAPALGGRVLLVLADVCGKGTPAALAGAVLLGMLDRAALQAGSPADILTEINGRLAERLPEEMFITAFCRAFDPSTGDLCYANAGHEHPLLLRTGAICELEATGMALGMLPETEYQQQVTCMSPGEVLVCFTDGVTDLRLAAGERAGVDRLRTLVCRHGAREYVELVEHIRSDLLRAAHDPEHLEDDFTLLAFRYTGQEPGRPGP